MDVNDTYDYSDELNEGGRRRIRGGCTIGRIINLCMALDFLLVMVTALIVSGTLGGINLDLRNSYGDHPDEQTPVNHEVCILYSSCQEAESGSACNFRYNKSGVCKYVEVAFGFVALMALVYIVISIVRAVLSTNISFTVFIDFVVIVLTMFVTFATGVTVSIGLSFTCSAVKDRYGDKDSCDHKVPNVPPPADAPADAPTPYEETGANYYRPVNVSQSCSWLCFAFLSVLLIMTIVRMVIFFKRRRGLREQEVDDITDVLTREHDEDEDAKPI